MAAVPRWTGLDVRGEPFVGVDSLHFGDQELALMDSITVERTKASGTTLEFYYRDLLSSLKSQYGDETKVWRGPYVMAADVKWPEKTPEATEQGGKATWEATAWIPRKLYDDLRLQGPKVGDVVRVWKMPYYRAYGQSDLTSETAQAQAGYYFTVDKVADKGHVFDTGTFMGFELTIKRDSEFTPERILSPETP